MAKLRFDPVTYQFYYQCPPQEGAPAKAAGFGWDPIRRRYYTEDPSIAVNFEACADSYAKLLLADVLSAAPSHKHQERSREASAWRPRSKAAAISSPAFQNGMDAALGDRPTTNARDERPNHEQAYYTMSSDGQNRRPQPRPIARDGGVRRGSRGASSEPAGQGTQPLRYLAVHDEGRSKAGTKRTLCQAGARRIHRLGRQLLPDASARLRPALPIKFIHIAQILNGAAE
jgi:hypothetical protein